MARMPLAEDNLRICLEEPAAQIDEDRKPLLYTRVVSLRTHARPGCLGAIN